MVGYYIPTAVSGAGPFTVTFNFWAGDPTDSTPPGAVGSSLISSFSVGGLNGGAVALGITGLSIPVGADFYIEQDYAGNGIINGGPLLTFNSGGTVGYSHSAFSQTGSMWTLSGGWADFYHSVDVPEPTTISLMVVGGLLALRRRK